MKTRLQATAAAVIGMTAIAVLPACGQTVERRVNGAPAGSVQFHFAAREGVCGDGRTYVRADGDGWYGSFNDMVRSMPCEAGPIRVLLVRDGRDLVRVQTYAGPLASEPGATDLGAVPASDAATYLVGVASRVDGRPGRDALLPAMLADSATVTRDLLALAKDQQRSRDVRRSAVSWLVRRRGEKGGLSADELSRTLTTIARDESENRDVRSQAVSSLARLETAEGLAAIVAMTQDASDTWLARRSVEALSSTGDPRSRQYLRAAAERTELTEEGRVAAINGLAGEYSTSKDGEFLRSLYKKVNSDRLKDAVMNGVAQIGGGDSREWILGLARDANEPVRQRKRAIEFADRIGMTASDLSKLYDSIDDAEVRATIISELGQLGTHAASDKLISIAKGDPSVSNRRRAIQALGRFDDPKVREALKELVER
jgi:HEAT repeat protein